MKKYLLLFGLFVSISCFSQAVNDYKYVIVPTKFTGFKENDKYRLNTTTKMLLEKYGFKTFLSTDNIPMEIGDNCQRLYADLVQDKDFFTTKVKIVLKDCREDVVYETDFGKSREKDYSKAYNEALRQTAASFDRLNYKYNGKNDSINVATPAQAIDNTTATATVTEPKEPQVKPYNEVLTKPADVFYFAQQTPNGFQVVDNEPKVIMRLFNTTQKNVFIALKGNINGVVITKNGEWFFEHYDNGKFVSELLKLKF